MAGPFEYIIALSFIVAGLLAVFSEDARKKAFYASVALVMVWIMLIYIPADTLPTFLPRVLIKSLLILSIVIGLIYSLFPSKRPKPVIFWWAWVLLAAIVYLASG